MFQFGGFPTHTYVFSMCSMILHHGGFPIRKSADRSLFAAPRSFSQLITSFIGSLCQGIHLMLLFAWTFLFSSSLFELLEFHKQIMISVINSSVKRFYPFFFWILFPPFGEIVIYPNWKDLWFFANLLVKSFVLLSVRFLLFNTLFGFQWTYPLLPFGNWWAQVDSNHRPRAYQARALTTWAMSPR